MLVYLQPILITNVSNAAPWSVAHTLQTLTLLVLLWEKSKLGGGRDG